MHTKQARPNIMPPTLTPCCTNWGVLLLVLTTTTVWPAGWYPLLFMVWLGGEALRYSDTSGAVRRLTPNVESLLST